MSHHILTTRAIIRNNDQILVVKHNNPHSHHYSLPGGKMEGDESIRDGLKRELMEELGVEAQIGDIMAVHEFVHPIYHGRRLEYLLDVTNGGDFRGEKLRENATHSHELAEVLWIKIADIAEYDIRPVCIADIIREGNTHIHFLAD